MLKFIDTQCNNCNCIEEQLIENKEDIKLCPVCGKEMHRIFTSMNFKLKYTPSKDTCGWADTGYASSQYWSQVKKEKEKGNNVKAINE